MTVVYLDGSAMIAACRGTYDSALDAAAAADALCSLYITEYEVATHASLPMVMLLNTTALCLWAEEMGETARRMAQAGAPVINVMHVAAALHLQVDAMASTDPVTLSLATAEGLAVVAR